MPRFSGGKPGGWRAGLYLSLIHISFGEDYRYQTAPHPVAALESRDCDDTRVGRSPTETADAELLVRTLQKA